MITLEVNNIPFSDFTEASVTLALDTLTRSFSFLSTNVPVDGVITFPFKRGDRCVVFVDGERVVTGHIETIQGSGNARSHMLRVMGRGLSADLIDSQLFEPPELNAENLALIDIIRMVIDNIGTPITVIDNVVPAPFNVAEDLVAPEMGMGAMELLEQYASKRQVLLSEDDNGNIVIANSTPSPVNYQLIHKVNSDTNNVISYFFDESDIDLYNKYIIVGAQSAVVSALNTNEILARFGIDPIIFQSNALNKPVIDDDVRAGRQFVSIMETGFSNDQCNERAAWSKQIRIARARRYSVIVNGYRDFDGALFTINSQVGVSDDYADIQRDQLVNALTFQYSSRGSLTTMGLLEVDAYTQQPG